MSHDLHTTQYLDAFEQRSRGIEGPKLVRFKQAYAHIAFLRLTRAQALTSERLNKEAAERRDKEAAACAAMFCAEEDTGVFDIGCSNFESNRAFVWVIEAARCLAAGDSNHAFTRKLLWMAINEISGRGAAGSQ
jgi:hypothetical protein